MPLFHPQIITKYTTSCNIVPAAHATILTQWATSLAQKVFNRETSHDGEFIQRILIDVLGYTGSSSGKHWTLSKNQPVGAGNVDIALGHFTADSIQIIAPFELKGAKTTDLDAIMPGRNKSPVQQAWEYAMDAKGAKWVLVSNYREIRLYAVGYGRKDYETFDLTTLTKPAQYAHFMLVLAAENLLGQRTAELLTESENKEKEISAQFYKDYHTLRLSMIATLTQDNAALPILEIIPLTQTILDRILFVAFAEDKGLLPKDTLKSCYDDRSKWNPQPAWENFKALFNSINHGNPPLNIPGYNGGLFAPDDKLNNLTVSDALCAGFKKIGGYDFESEISVNILGHIFEQSITDLEEIKANLNSETPAVNKKSSKRKRDGIFYTPSYITRYIVEQAVGGWLNDRKQAIGFNELPALTEADYASIELITRGARKGSVTYNANIDKHIQAWEAYKTALANIKVLDPACGSGAFLNEVFDYLYREGQAVNRELTTLNANQAQLFRWDTHILANNIYGVDINRESVEITKLSLWLKTANRNEKLTYLENNIKCGNSLIDDPAIAGERAFKWKEQFAAIMNAGGFDVVVGNPPYGATLLKPQIDYLDNKINVSSYQSETYIYFIFQAHNLIKSGGYCGLIVPNTWMTNVFSQSIRHYILDSLTIISVQHYLYNVFSSANVDSQSIITKKLSPTNNNIIVCIVDKQETIKYEVEQKFWQNFSDTSINIYQTSKEIRQLSQKLSENDKLEKFFKITQGTKPFQIGKGTPKQTCKILEDKPYVSDFKKDISFVPLLRGSLINKYIILWNNNYWISFGDWLAEPRYSASYDAKEKIIIRQTGDSLICTLDTQQFIVRDNLYDIVQKIDQQINISLISLCGLINSKLLNWYYQNVINSEEGEVLAQVKKSHISLLPLPIFSSNPIFLNIENSVFIMLKINKELHEVSAQFIELLKIEFNLDKLNTKLQEWYTLEVAAFIAELSKELKKKKMILNLKQKNEWIGHFKQQKAIAIALKNTLDTTDREIDQMVYTLYGLTPEEIALVEGAE